MDSGQIVVESLEAVGLVGGLAYAALVEVLELLDLPPVVLALQLVDLDLLVEVGGLESQLGVSVALLGVVLVQAQALEVSVVEQALLARELLLQVVALLVPTMINRLQSTVK